MLKILEKFRIEYILHTDVLFNILDSFRRLHMGSLLSETEGRIKDSTGTVANNLESSD